VLRDLGVEPALLADAHTQARHVASAADVLQTAVASARGSVEQVGDAVSSRQQMSHELSARYLEVTTATANFVTMVEEYNHRAGALRTAVEAATRSRVTVSGLAEMADLLARRADVIADVVAESKRQRIIKRLNGAEKQLRDACRGGVGHTLRSDE
jgi:hypothetical protein